MDTLNVKGALAGYFAFGGLFAARKLSGLRIFFNGP